LNPAETPKPSCRSLLDTSVVIDDFTHLQALRLALRAA
jgi:hypothetical protein